ncbi:DUF1963 domain-containing protein [Streptomyces sp. NBC_01708]|uniref:DUF1963 domain-containing protein n=1 Tax=Streptomyces sp. NBC_01708 TaxID=2975915 RepID=UPI002E356700|nr:DUF1963 domain-containing protein [Streptomyces sp. NBC_01708]
MDPETTLSALREFCAERLGAELAARFVALARPGFALTAAGPGEAAGHSRFGGRALLEPGTLWPAFEGFPLSLLAILDNDVLAPWLGDLLPAGTGLLNFFYLDSDSEQCDPAAFRLAAKCFGNEPQVGRVIAARSAHAVEVTPPARSSTFAPVSWAASPGFAFPDPWDRAYDTLELGPEADDMARLMPGMHIEDRLTEWSHRPGALGSEDVAFGWPEFPTGSSLWMPDGEDPNLYHHLLQLSSRNEWHIGGDGGWMHWSTPTEALRAGDFSRAIPTPDIW